MAIKGFPVVISENDYGLPVISVDKNAPLATVYEPPVDGVKLGVPIILVEKNGIPLIIQNLPVGP